jgi:Fe(3+) dicitrate transport protein
MFSRQKLTRAVLMTGAAWFAASSAASAQEAAEPAQQPLPEVEVIQKKAPAAKKAAPVAKKQAAPAPSPTPQPPPVEVVDEPPSEPNPIYGSPASAGAAARASQSAQTPVNPAALIPSNLDGFSSAATNLSPETLQKNQPRNINDALSRVPGVIIINDDGNAQHGGVAVRGSPARRSRKMLVMEDGHPVNLALWLDPSVHYWGPIDRYESVEVIRGTVVTHGPNNNFGVINARNLSPFGPDETVISSAIGFTRSKTGSWQAFEGDGVGSTPQPDGAPVFGGNDTDLSARWHTHTRQSIGNVGIVASYSGANVQGAWDTERLRFNDFYGAIGWKGPSSDLVVSASYARQRDNYDEQNFLGNYELGEFGGTPGYDEDDAEDEAELVAEGFRGLAEQQFAGLKHCKTCFAPNSGLNTYVGDIWRGQAVHNAYLDDDTTITTRFYAGHHTRDRYQLFSFDAAPDGTPGGDPPVFAPDLNTQPGDLEDSSVFFGENTMFGRLRTFRHVGAEVRGEWANVNLLGFNNTVQAGIRYEYQDMTNRNFIGLENEILGEGDTAGATIFDRELDSNAVSAFLQTNVKVARDFNVVPGIRFEWYRASRINRVVAREESEAGGGSEDNCDFFYGDDDCLEIDGLVLNPDPTSESFDNFHALPGIAFAYTGLNRTTVFGGYHRGMSTGVLRNEDFPVKDEIGDNFNLGLRSSAIRGFDFEVAGFYQLLQNYQFGATFNAAVDRSFGRADEVEISGVELLGRLNSQPFTGGSLNLFAEGQYTYSRGIFKDTSSLGEDFSGNRIPEVPLHVAALTLGIEQNKGWRWDASMTWTYRGAFFTDEANTRLSGGEVECEQEDPIGNPTLFECEIEEAGEDGEVPSIWLLSARFNMDIGDTGASVFIAGDNLLDRLYISDREDGMKPGLGRTVWAGFKYKF